jgi:Flp pilus assembly protein CpaB
MRRSPRVYVAWCIAALATLITARIVAEDLGTLRHRARALGRDVPVVLAARDLQLGSAVTASDVEVVRRPAATVAPGTLGDRDAVVGRVVAVPVLAGDAVRDRALVAADRNAVDGLIPVGFRAVHVVLDDGFRPPPGAVVDVLASSDGTTVAPGARVLAVDDGDDSGDELRGPSALTLLVTEAQARAVVYAAANSRLAVVVAPPESAAAP